MLQPFHNKIFHGNCIDLLKLLPTASIDSCIADPMYGVVSKPKPSNTYDWGVDPCRGDPDEWWRYHEPIYREVRRVLKPGGSLAWAMGFKFRRRFEKWFGPVRIWSLSRSDTNGRSYGGFAPVWVVQTREQERIQFPNKDGLIITPAGGCPKLLKGHPCPKIIEEMVFIVENLSRPGDLILDCFCGTGTTCAAAKMLGRNYIGCDIGRRYCQIAMKRLAELATSGTP